MGRNPMLRVDSLHAYMLTCLHAYMHVLTCLHACASLDAYMLTRLHAYTLTCMCVHVCTLICFNLLRHDCVSTCLRVTCLRAYMCFPRTPQVSLESGRAERAKRNPAMRNRTSLIFSRTHATHPLLAKPMVFSS